MIRDYGLAKELVAGPASIVLDWCGLYEAQRAHVSVAAVLSMGRG
jgi:hypothetical protein